MRFNPKARLDTGQVTDSSGGGGGFGRGGGGLRIPIPRGRVGRGGLGGVLVVVLFLVLRTCLADGGGGGLTGSGAGAPGGSGLDSGQVAGTGRYAECRTGADANRSPDCARVAVVNSIQDFWGDNLEQLAGTPYQLATTHTFAGSVGTGCGNATSQVGPFYCPRDGTVYLDTTFFDEVLERQLGGPDGGFVEYYVIGHEYGHHVQNLLGTMGQVRTQQGPESDAVRLELQADCYAGMWARAATGTDDATGQPLIAELTDDDLRLAIEAAEAVGDDRIQQRTQGQVNPEAWTHGSAAQRQRWFTIGFNEGTLAACDTFSAQQL